MDCTGVVPAPAHSVSGSKPPLLHAPVPLAIETTADSSTLPGAGESVTSLTGDEIQLSWLPSLPTPSDLQEERAIRALFPGVDFGGSKRSLASQLQRYRSRWEDMSSTQQAQITRVCRDIGFDLGQAIGLRTTVYRSAQPWKFEGSEQETQLKAEAFEDGVEAILLAHGVEYQTQAQQIAAAYEEGSPALPPTPDFLVRSRLVINNRPVRWIEVKNFYGAGIEHGIKPWTPTLKIQRQLAKYVEAYGPHGAVVLKHGYALSFRARTSECIQLLDGGKLRKE